MRDEYEFKDGVRGKYAGTPGNRFTGEGQMKASIKAVGEEGTGFVKGRKLGEFNCRNCVHMNKKDGVCEHPIMDAVSDQPRGKNNFPKVAPEDCCQYQRRPGDK